MNLLTNPVMLGNDYEMTYMGKGRLAGNTFIDYVPGMISNCLSE